MDEVTGLVKLAFQWGKADNKEIKTEYIEVQAVIRATKEIEENKGNKVLMGGWVRDGPLFYSRKGLINNVTYL